VRNYLTIPLLLLLNNFTFAQTFQEKDFTLYSIEQGLSNRHVTAIAQDRYGYLWVATQKGLNRFDGTSFQTFYADSNSNSLPQNQIAKLKWLNNEQLGVLTTTGLHIVNTTTAKGENLVIPAGELKYTFRVNYISDVAGDPGGNIFILTRSGFYEFNKQRQLVFRYDAYN
jgi:ligand-binding sensor domain-containing protein